MRKRLPEPAKMFIDRVETDLEWLAQEVGFVVTGSTNAFGGELAILHREMLASGSHIRIFTALGQLFGLKQNEVFELYKRLPADRQASIDEMVKRAIAEEIADQDIRPETLPAIKLAPVAPPPITLAAEVKVMESICHDLRIPLR